MDVIRFGRAMRKHGWSYRRGPEKGLAYFGMRFPNGKGRTVCVHLPTAARSTISAWAMAEYMTYDAALAVGHDLRAVA